MAYQMRAGAVRASSIRDHIGEMRWARDRGAVALVAFFIGLAVGAAAVEWSADDPAPASTWRLVAPEVARVTDSLLPSVTLRTDKEACTALLAWTRSHAPVSQSILLERVGVEAWEYAAATYRCAAIGVWPS